MNDAKPIPHWRLLAGVNRTQSWRRLKSAVAHSRLHAFLMGLFVLSYALLAYALFHKALQFTSSFPGLGPVLIERMMFLLFAFLFLLLLLSNVIINFTNLFRNKETQFLLSLPVPRQVVYRWKVFESGILASWAFLFLIAPLVAAYGAIYNAPWHFYLVTPLFVALFVVLPAILGSWAALGLARWVDRLAFQVAVVLAVIVLIVVASSWLQPETVTDEMLETRVLDVVDRRLARTRFALFPFLPSYWVSSGITQWVEGALMGTFFFGLVLLSHTLFFGYLASTRTGGIFYGALSAVNSRGGGTAVGWKFWKHKPALGQAAFTPRLLDRLAKLLWWGRGDTRALIVKDIRTFWRDATQWGRAEPRHVDDPLRLPANLARGQTHLDHRHGAARDAPHAHGQVPLFHRRVDGRDDGACGGVVRDALNSAWARFILHADHRRDGVHPQRAGGGPRRGVPELPRG